MLVLSLGVGFNGPSAARAATAVNLLRADNFAVLANTTITNTGATTITGDLGLSPGTSVTGFPPGSVIGTQHVADTSSSDAQTDLVTAYNAASQSATTKYLRNSAEQLNLPVFIIPQLETFR